MVESLCPKICRFKVCQNCGDISEPTITSCPSCGSSNLERITSEEIERVLSEGGKVIAYFSKWPDNIYWQGVGSRQILESHKK